MTELTHGELFAGIGGFGLGFERAGIKTCWHVEIDKACQSVLRRRFPDTPIFDDVREVGGHNLSPVDVITFGSPCQDLSLAGKRKGLDGERSGLFFEAIRIVAELKPSFAVWENVPGAFSSNTGRDFAAVLAAFRECGARDICWRVLDAQYFGVAQRRRRVFIVADFGGQRAAEVLFESDRLPGHSAPRPEAGSGLAPTLESGINRTGGTRPPGSTIDTAESLIAFDPLMAGSERTFIHRKNGKAQLSGRADAIAFNIQHNDGGEHKRSDRPEGGMYINETDTALTIGTTDLTCVVDGLAATLNSSGNAGGNAGGFRTEPGEHIVAFAMRGRDDGSVPEVQGDMTSALRGSSGGSTRDMIAWEMSHADDPVRSSGDRAPALQARMGTGGNQVPLVGVRRLTPTECERLQGFPDGWTAGQADSTRYRQLGNAVAVPVVEWIARRLVASYKQD